MHKKNYVPIKKTRATQFETEYNDVKRCILFGCLRLICYSSWHGAKLSSNLCECWALCRIWSPTLLREQIWPIIMFGPLAIATDSSQKKKKLLQQIVLHFITMNEDLQICFQTSAARMFGQQTYVGARSMLGSQSQRKISTNLYNFSN